MPETLRDLVVSLSLQSDNFTRNIRSVNKQIQEAESFFKLAAAGVENFEQSTAGLDSRLTTLQQKLSLQREVVDQYQRALQAARDKLQECFDRQGDYANRLAEAQTRQASLNTLVTEAAKAYADCRARLGESDQATLDAAAHLNELRERYRETTEEVTKLAGQCEALQRATQNAADAVSTGNSNLNKASAAVKQTEADIDKTNQALALSQTNWRSAGESIQASQNALVSIGKQMQSADATFRLLTVDIKDVDSSTDGLTQKMTLLEERLRLQNQAVQEYQNILRATREQQAAAQSVGDADLIRQTTDAVTDAETALTRAQTAVRETEQAIDACNTQLTLANSGWFAAAESIHSSETAIAGIGNQLRLAESEFNLVTAGMQNVDTTVNGLTARSNMHTQQLNLQNQAVAEYANILGQAQVQLAAAQAANDPERINQATQAVTNAQAALNNANAAVKNTEAQLQACNNELTLANNGWYSAAEAMSNARATITAIGSDIAQAESEFRLATVGIEDMDSSILGLSAQMDMLCQKWQLQKDAITQYEAALQAAQQQLSAAQAAGDPEKIRQANSAVTEAQTALNNARTALAETENQIIQCSDALRLAETDWYSAGQAITNSQNAIATIGREIKVAESAFKASTAGIKDMDKSVYGLTEKLDMLRQRMSLQEEAVHHYEEALEAARTQLDAANEANDPDKIRQANDAVLDAETALNNANAALRETRSEIDQTNRQLRTAQSSWTAIGSAATSVGQALTNSSRATGMVGRAFSTMVTAPVTALGTAAIKASIDFESSFAVVRKTIDGTEEEFARLAAASKQMSTQVATSTTDINHVIATGGQLGIATEHIEDFTRVMIDLEKASTDLDAETAATQLAKFANIMGTDQSLFSNMGSVVAELGNNFATTEAPIVEMAMRIAGAGKQAGLTEAQVLGLAASLSSVGIQAQAGGSSISKALINMEIATVSGGKALQDFARVSGMSEQEFVEHWKSDPIDTFQRFISGVAQLDDAGISAIQTLNDMGISEIRLRDTLLRSVNASDLFARAQNMASEAWNKNTALAEKSATRYGTVESQMTNLKNKAMLFAQTLGDDLQPMLAKLTAGASGYIDKLMNMDSAQCQQLIQWAAIAAAVGPVLVAVSKLERGLGFVVTGFGKFATAVGAAGGGFSGFIATLAKSPTVWLAVAAAVTYGVYKLFDWVSGAKMAREATQALIDKANEWKSTAAETFYGKSGAGLSFFGMSEDDFKNDDTAKSARAWLTGLIDVWTDGKGETDEIVREWTDSWKSLNEATRTELQALQNSAKDAGYTGVADQIQTDIDSLDSMDREISALLKKRQNGYLTGDEKVRLQELIDNREAIIIRYKLQPDSETEGFQTILDKVEAEVARAQARGKQDADVSVYQNAIVAAAQGMATLNSQIDAQYDSEYALIQLMEEGAEKQAALASLNTSYNEQRLAATREYAQALAQLVNPVWNDEGMKQTGETLSELAGKLTMYDAAVKTYGEDSYQAAEALDAVKNAAVGLDEGSLTEYASVLTQISELLTSGMSMDEVQALFPDIDVSTALEQLASIQQFTSQYSSALEGLSGMFGEGLSEEVLKIATELDMTGAQANWDEFAANPGAITTDAIIAGVQEQENAARQQILVDAVIDRFTEKPEGADKTALTPEGLIAYVGTYAEATTGADVSSLTPENVTAMVAAYQEMAEGADMSTLKPDEIVAYVNKYLEKSGVDTSALKPEAVTAFVLAYQEVAGGALTTALTPDDITAMVVRYLEAEGVDVSALKPDQVEALVNKFSEATGCDKSALAQSLTGYITQYDDSAATVPTPSCKLSIEGYDLTSLQQFQANNPVTVTGVVRLGDRFENPEAVLDAEDAHFYYNGQEIPVNLVPAEKLTAETIIAYDADGALHVLIMPEIGTPEAVEESIEQMGDKIGKGNAFLEAIHFFSSTDDDVRQILNLADTVDLLRGKVEEFKASGDFSMSGQMQMEVGATLGELDQQLRNLNEQDIANIGQEAAQLMAALNSGNLDTEQMESYAAELQRIYDLLAVADEVMGEGNPVTQGIADAMSAYDWQGDATTIMESIQGALATAMPQVGSDASAGVGQGLGQYDFSGDAATAADNLEGAYRGSLQSQSPAQRMVPLGNDVSAGVGQGMTQYSFAGDSSTAASNLMAALSAALAAQTSTAASSARGIGTAISSGIASGIRSGQSAVIQAAVMAARSALSAAKAALAIHSPSGVFREEVGLMAMKGMGEGFLEGQKEQARIIRNAARYLTEEAQNSIVAGNTRNDNRQTFHQQSSVNLTGNSFYIRSDQDLHDLAVEIATLTRTEQRGRGLRAT